MGALGPAIFLTILAICTLLFISVIVLTFYPKREVKKFGLMMLVLLNSLSPFFLRFVVGVSVETWFNYSPFVGILGFIYIFVSFLLQLVFCVASTNYNPKNENLLTRQGHYEIFFKEIFTSILIILCEFFTYKGFSLEAEITITLGHILMCLFSFSTFASIQKFYVSISFTTVNPFNTSRFFWTAWN